MRWRLILEAPDETAVAEFGPEGADGNGGIIGFPSFDLDANGNCLTLSFDAVPKLCNILPRDLVTMQRYDDATAGWVNWWKGVVTTAGTELSDAPQRYEALGLKQLFYERVLLTNRWPAGTELSTDAADIPAFDEAVGFPIPGVTRDSSSAPELGFEVGVTIPNRQSFGEFLDARARQVGAFVVPTGETYEYDGETFAAGDVVPAVKWGVDADGLWFFRRDLDAVTPTQLTEGDPNVEVQWSPYTSEGKANFFTFVLFSDVERENLLNASLTERVTVSGPFFIPPTRSSQPVFRPITAQGPLPAPDPPVVEETIVVENPLDFMTRNDLTVIANDLWTNTANAVDGNPGTFSTFGGSFTPITATGGTVTDVGDYRIHTFTSNGTFTVTDAGSNPQVEYLIVAGGGGGGATPGETASGGGAGGMIEGVATVAATSYSVVVGAGGGGGSLTSTPTSGSKGSDSSAFGVTAEGGGRGRGSDDDGGSGGSGGGARAGATLKVGGSGEVDQGSNGGSAQNTGPIRDAAAGGGGAGGPAPNVIVNVSADAAGAGGPGLTSLISGSPVTYATGGAGVVSGGGTSGAANTGDGGEGGGGVAGGDGGSGVVIIRYVVNAPTFDRVAGTTFDFSSPTVLETDSVFAGDDGGAYLVWYSSDEPTAFAVRTVSNEIKTTILGTETRTVTNELQFEYPGTNTDTAIRPRAILLPALQQASGTQIPGSDATLYVFGATGLRIHDMAFYSVDPVAIQRVAEGRIRPPVTEAAVVNLRGYHPVESVLEISALNLLTVTIPVERTEYTLTVSDGVQTRYFAGQRYDPVIEAERSVLNALVRRVTNTKDVQ